MDPLDYFTPLPHRCKKITHACLNPLCHFMTINWISVPVQWHSEPYQKGTGWMNRGVSTPGYAGVGIGLDHPRSFLTRGRMTQSDFQGMPSLEHWSPPWGPHELVKCFVMQTQVQDSEFGLFHYRKVYSVHLSVTHMPAQIHLAL